MPRPTHLLLLLAIALAMPVARAGTAGDRGRSAEEVVTRAGTSAWAARSLSQRDLDRLGKLISKTSERAAGQLAPSDSVVRAGADAWATRGMTERDLDWLGSLFSGGKSAAALPVPARPSRGPSPRGTEGRKAPAESMGS